MCLDWPVPRIPKLGPQWRCGTSPLVWRMQGTRIIAPRQNGWTSGWWMPHQVCSWECRWIQELWSLWSLLWCLMGQRVFCTFHFWMILMISLLLRFWRGRLFDVKIVKISKHLNSLTAIGPYMAHRFSWDLFKFNNFSNFCPLTTFDSSKCSE